MHHSVGKFPSYVCGPVAFTAVASANVGAIILNETYQMHVSQNPPDDEDIRDSVCRLHDRRDN